MKCTVFYESWQMECCGTGFSVDDRVKWLVNKIKQPITVGNIGEINYCYEAHSSDWQNIFVLEGKLWTQKKQEVLKKRLMIWRQADILSC